MDYSTLPNDPDHPVGSSPWQSSPQPTSKTFPASEDSSAPSSPLAKHSSFPGEPPSVEQEGSHESPINTDNGAEFNQAAAGNAAPSSETNGQGYTIPNSQQNTPTFPQSPFPPQQQQVQQQGQQQAGRQPQQQQRTAPNRYHGTGPRTQQRQNLPQYRLRAKITSLERTGRKDPVLRFDVHVCKDHTSHIHTKGLRLTNNVQTNLPKFRTTQFRDVRRTHSEFMKLADHLISSNPEAFVPAVPPPLTSAGAGTDEDETRVKNSMQRWMNVVCGNDVLMRDDEMIFFVESDAGYSPVMRMKQPATGVRRKVIKQFAPPPDDTPELHEARPVVKQFYLGTMETGQKVDRVVKARRGTPFPIPPRSNLPYTDFP